MSNISQTKKDLKKKLSFNDYGISVRQQSSIPEDNNTSKPAELSVSQPIPQQTATPIQKQTDLPASRQESIMVHKQEDITAQLQDVSTLNHNDNNKVKQYDSAGIPVSLQNSLPLNLNTIDGATAQHFNVNMIKQNDSTDSTANKHTALPSNPNYINTAGQHTCSTSSHQAGFTGKPVEHFSNMAVHHCHCNRAFQENTIPKIKATYYLSQEDNQALIDIYIKRLQSKNKTDKSALIAEAINLLYKKEMM